MRACSDVCPVAVERRGNIAKESGESLCAELGKRKREGELGAWQSQCEQRLSHIVWVWVERVSWCELFVPRLVGAILAIENAQSGRQQQSQGVKSKEGKGTGRFDLVELLGNG